jgi:uncharacterized membrane protein YjjP (DUF1212 family)
MSADPSNAFFVALGAALVLSALLSMRHGKPREGWPFTLVILASGINIAISPLTAAITPIVPITFVIVLLIAAILTFPRAKIPPNSQPR